MQSFIQWPYFINESVNGHVDLPFRCDNDVEKKKKLMSFKCLYWYVFTVAYGTLEVCLSLSDTLPIKIHFLPRVMMRRLMPLICVSRILLALSIKTKISYETTNASLFKGKKKKAFQP